MASTKYHLDCRTCVWVSRGSVQSTGFVFCVRFCLLCISKPYIPRGSRASGGGGTLTGRTAVNCLTHAPRAVPRCLLRRRITISIWRRMGTGGVPGTAPSPGGGVPWAAAYASPSSPPLATSCLVPRAPAHSLVSLASLPSAPPPGVAPPLAESGAWGAAAAHTLTAPPSRAAPPTPRPAPRT